MCLCMRMYENASDNDFTSQVKSSAVDREQQRQDLHLGIPSQPPIYIEKITNFS